MSDPHGRKGRPLQSHSFREFAQRSSMLGGKVSFAMLVERERERDREGGALHPLTESVPLPSRKLLSPISHAVSLQGSRATLAETFVIDRCSAGTKKRKKGMCQSG